MEKAEMTSGEIIRTISNEAVRQIGPWPTTLDIFVFRIEGGWECLITPTDDPAEERFRNAALKIGITLSQFVKLKE